MAILEEILTSPTIRPYYQCFPEIFKAHVINFDFVSTPELPLQSVKNSNIFLFLVVVWAKFKGLDFQFPMEMFMKLHSSKWIALLAVCKDSFVRSLL